MTLSRATILLGFTLVGSACSPDPSAPPSVAAGAGFGTTAAVETSKHAAFEAQRRYTSFSGPAMTSYTERFVKAEDGRTKVELLELNGKPLAAMTTQAEIDAFVTTAALLLGGAGRYVAVGRDFAVRDVEPFLQNYTLSILTGSDFVAGRTCIVAEVRPLHNDRPNYMVWADAEYFTTLKFVERLPSGAVAAEMECLTVDFAFNSKNEVFPESPASDPAEVSSTSLTSLVGFEVFEPSYIPAGFVFEGVNYSTIAARPILTWSYTDGIQELFVAEYAEIGTPEAPPPDTYPDDAPVHVRVTVLGAVVSTTFVIDGTQVHVKGKVEPDELMTVVESLTSLGG